MPYIGVFSEENIQKAITHAASKLGTASSDLLGDSDEDDSAIAEIDLDHVIKYLVKVSELRGQFSIQPSARKLWKDWYASLRADIDSGIIDDDTGTIQRIHDNALKLAMLLSLSERLDLVINESNMNEAIEKSEECFQATKQITTGKGKSEESDKARILLEYLLSRPDFKASRREILRAKWKDIDGVTLTKIIDTIGPGGANIIQVQNCSEGQIYFIDDKYVRQFKAKLSRITVQ